LAKPFEIVVGKLETSQSSIVLLHSVGRKAHHPLGGESESAGGNIERRGFVLRHVRQRGSGAVQRLRVGSRTHTHFLPLYPSFSFHEKKICDR